MGEGARNIGNMDLRYSSMERPPLEPERLRASLVGPAGPLSRLDVVQETGSTNTDLADSARLSPREYPDFSVLTAELQTAGRGRLGRVWQAPERSSLFVSVLLRPVNAQGRPLPTQSYGWLSLLAALSLSKAVGGRTGVEPRLKWPNDVMVDGRKLAGVLAQLVPDSTGNPPAVVVGVGLNVSLTDEDQPVSTGTSLLMEYASTTDRNILLEDFLLRFNLDYRAFCAVDGNASAPWSLGGCLLDNVAGRMATLGQEVRAHLPGGAELTGRAAGLDAHGALLIIDGDGVRQTVTAADVVHLRPAGA